MKYLKLFSTESDRNTYLSGNFDKPNVSVVKGSAVISYTPKTNTLEFPVYLKDGDNGETGVMLYNYLIAKYLQTEKNSYINLHENDVIYVVWWDREEYVMALSIYGKIRSNQSIELYYGATMGSKILYPTGLVEQEYSEPL